MYVTECYVVSLLSSHYTRICINVSTAYTSVYQTDSRGDLDLFAYDSASSIYMSASDADTGTTAVPDTAATTSTSTGSKRPTTLVPPGDEVLVRAQLEIPPLSALAAPTVEQREKSLVLQSLLSKSDGKESSTISVLWNMTDNVKYVQNLMNCLLDQIESAKNIFNWTSPNKTWPIYLAVVALWLVTIVVPGRLLILAIGLYEFFFIFLPIPEGRNNVIRFSNLLQSIPNDDDISEIYSTERKAFASAKLAEWKQTERSRKVDLVVPTRWKGSVGIKGSSLGGGGGGTGSAGMTEDWVRVFLLLQGHRLVWWVSEEALDTGKVADPSPCCTAWLAYLSVFRLVNCAGPDRTAAAVWTLGNHAGVACGHS
jgi:hypothetical protein